MKQSKNNSDAAGKDNHRQKNEFRYRSTEEWNYKY